MGKKVSRGFSQDLSSFMCIILMLIGVMVIMLITNTVVIVSNPENIRITSIIQSSGEYLEGGKGEDAGAPPFPFGNKEKEPSYVDVHPDHLVIYPGAEIVALRDLERKGNALERLLNIVQTNRNVEYVVLLARPGTATIVHRLKKVIRDRDIDLGCELYEAARPVEFDRAAKASGRSQ
jgi:hypothetical protein